MPLNLANYLAFGSARARTKLLPVKLALWLAVFATSFSKQVLIRIGPRIPLAGSLRRLLARHARARDRTARP